MITLKKTDSNKCLICNNESGQIKIVDMAINRNIRTSEYVNNANIITFAICENCIQEMCELIKYQVIESKDLRVYPKDYL